VQIALEHRQRRSHKRLKQREGTAAEREHAENQAGP
jgi:hypothetical protein